MREGRREPAHVSPSLSRTPSPVSPRGEKSIPPTRRVNPGRNRMEGFAVHSAMYRYRLIDEQTGDDLGPFVSLRLTFAPGELIARTGSEHLHVVNVVEPENEAFRAYLVVRAQAA